MSKGGVTSCLLFPTLQKKVRAKCRPVIFPILILPEYRYYLYVHYTTLLPCLICLAPPCKVSPPPLSSFHFSCSSSQVSYRALSCPSNLLGPRFPFPSLPRPVSSLIPGPDRGGLSASTTVQPLHLAQVPPLPPWDLTI